MKKIKKLTIEDLKEFSAGFKSEPDVKNARQVRREMNDDLFSRNNSQNGDNDAMITNTGTAGVSNVNGAKKVGK